MLYRSRYIIGILGIIILLFVYRQTTECTTSFVIIDNKWETDISLKIIIYKHAEHDYVLEEKLKKGRSKFKLPLYLHGDEFFMQVLSANQKIEFKKMIGPVEPYFGDAVYAEISDQGIHEKWHPMYPFEFLLIPHAFLNIGHQLLICSGEDIEALMIYY